MQEIVAAAAKKERERVATEIIEAQTKVVTASCNSAAAYTNLIMLGGYAGYFGLWQLTREHLSKTQALWVALLILISLLTFIAFEVIKIFLSRERYSRRPRYFSHPKYYPIPKRSSPP